MFYLDNCPDHSGYDYADQYTEETWGTCLPAGQPVSFHMVNPANFDKLAYGLGLWMPNFANRMDYSRVETGWAHRSRPREDR